MYVSSTVCDEITYLFPNLDGCTVEVWKWMNNFIPHFIMDVITYQCWDVCAIYVNNTNNFIYTMNLHLLTVCSWYITPLLNAMGRDIYKSSHLGSITPHLCHTISGDDVRARWKPGVGIFQSHMYVMFLTPFVSYGYCWLFHTIHLQAIKWIPGIFKKHIQLLTYMRWISPSFFVV